MRILTKKYRNKKEKSWDVEMACQKVHKQGRIKVIVNIQSLICPYIFSRKSNLKDVGTGLCILTITFILPCLCAISTSLCIFNDFSFFSRFQSIILIAADCIMVSEVLYSHFVKCICLYHNKRKWTLDSEGCLMCAQYSKLALNCFCMQGISTCISDKN